VDGRCNTPLVASDHYDMNLQQNWNNRRSLPNDESVKRKRALWIRNGDGFGDRLLARDQMARLIKGFSGVEAPAELPLETRIALFLVSESFWNHQSTKVVYWLSRLKPVLVLQTWAFFKPLLYNQNGAGNGNTWFSNRLHAP